MRPLQIEFFRILLEDSHPHIRKAIAVIVGQPARLPLVMGFKRLNKLRTSYFVKLLSVRTPILRRIFNPLLLLSSVDESQLNPVACSLLRQNICSSCDALRSLQAERRWTMPTPCSHSCPSEWK